MVPTRRVTWYPQEVLHGTHKTCYMVPENRITTPTAHPTPANSIKTTTAIRTSASQKNTIRCQIWTDVRLAGRLAGGDYLPVAAFCDKAICQERIVLLCIHTHIYTFPAGCPLDNLSRPKYCVFFFVLKCSFTSTETARTIRDVNGLLLGTESPGRPPKFSHGFFNVALRPQKQ